MAYNELDVTTAAADLAFGPVWWSREIVKEVPGLDFDPRTDPRFIQLGETSTDGYNFEQSADEKQKLVMSKNLGSAYTNFADKLTLQFASTLDIDVLRVVFGYANVNLVDGAIVVAVRGRQPETGTLLIPTLTDDGRRRLAFCPKAQADINLSYTWNEDDITVFETVFNLTAVDQLANHYEIIETADGEVEVLSGPAPASVKESSTKE